jgi:hypothetical protein
MVTGKSPIVPMTWATQGQPSSDASEEVPMVTQLDEEKKTLVGVGKGQLGKGAQKIQGFCRQVPTKGEISSGRRSVVEHQELPFKS